MRADQRSVILIAGAQDLHQDHKLQISRRSLSYKLIDLSAIEERTFSEARAVIIAEPPGRFRQLSALSPELLQKLLNAGLMISYLAADDAASDRATARKAQEKRFTYTKRPPSDIATTNDILLDTWFYIHPEFEAILEVIRRHDPGPSIDETTARVDSASVIPESHQILMRRAFHDASHIIAERLSGGQVSDGAYRVFVNMRNRGPQPMPYFFKVAESKYIKATDDWDDSLGKERVNYERWAEPYIPFHLRPGLIRDRSINGLFWSALACHFVDGAAPLEVSLLNRQGAGILFSLFETTLRGLRAHTLDATPEKGVVSDFIRSRVKAHLLNTDLQRPRVQIARRLGLSIAPEELKSALIKRAEDIEAKCGLYHGDLHLRNVMVRQRDAIVIDFGSMRDRGPITADPSALEVSIVFGPVDCDPSARGEWLKFAESIYLDPENPIRPAVDHFRFAWMARAVRELRHVAKCCGVSSKERIVVLAASLLRHACFPPAEHQEPGALAICEERKAFALATAEKLWIMAGKI